MSLSPRPWLWFVIQNDSASALLSVCNDLLSYVSYVIRFLFSFTQHNLLWKWNENSTNTPSCEYYNYCEWTNISEELHVYNVDHFALVMIPMRYNVFYKNKYKSSFFFMCCSDTFEKSSYVHRHIVMLKIFTVRNFWSQLVQVFQVPNCN